MALQTFKNNTSNDMPLMIGSAADLNLADVLTVDDLFPSLEFPFSMSQLPSGTADTSMQDLGIDWTSTLNPQTNTQSRLSPDDQPLLDDQELDLDFGDDVGMPGNDTSISLEVGRSAPPPRPIGEDLFSDNNVLDGDEPPLDLGDVQMQDQPGLGDGDLPDFANEDPLALPDDETLQLQNAAPHDAGDATIFSDPAEFDRTFADQGDISEVAVQQPQRTKKRKAVLPDAETVLHNRQIKAQAEDRSKILKPLVFLPRDPLLLSLMEMQRQGEFVTGFMNDTRSHNWAPELQGLISIDAFRKSTDRKRKRDSGIADVSDDDGHSEKSPRLQRTEDVQPEDEGVELGGGHDVFDFDAPTDQHAVAVDEYAQQDEQGIFGGGDEFDETVLPLIHPADNGAVSVSTKRAVHLLREEFGGQSSDTSPGTQTKKSVLLQDLVPERQTSKSDATKMFFEVLVLATKDAIKVEQSDKSIGLPLRIRAKRGLWGSWAETSAPDEATPSPNRLVATAA